MRYRKLSTHNVTLEGPRVTLRPLTEDDWDLLVKWCNDPGVLSYSAGANAPSFSLGRKRQIDRPRQRAETEQECCALHRADSYRCARQ